MTWPSPTPFGMTTSTSRPVGRAMRFFSSLATSSRETVSVASMSSPLSFRERRAVPAWDERKASPNSEEKMSSEAPPRPAGAEAEHALEVLGPRPGAAGAVRKALEALELRLALRVDLAAVELGALRHFAQDLVGGVDLGEAVLRLGVVLVAVGVVLLGE